MSRSGRAHRRAALAVWRRSRGPSSECLFPESGDGGRRRTSAPHARLARALALSRSVRELAVAGIRARHPNADEAEIRVRLVVRLYGRDLAACVYGAVPDDAV